MYQVDGSEGGGQLLRSALGLAMLTAEPVTIKHVRGGRPEPGLRPQHLAAVNVAAEVCDAEVTGAEVSSETVVFRPGKVRGGEYEVDVGTAGSVTLLFDTLLPVALQLERPLVLRARGGTDVKWSPPMAYHRQVKLPLLRRVGLQAVVERSRPGFYPAGKGEATLHLSPSSLSPLRLADRGDLDGVRVYSLAAESLSSDEVAERQARTAVDALEADDVPVVERTVTYADAACPGSTLLVRADYEETSAGFDALGEKGTPAEDVATDAVDDWRSFHRTAGALDRHMADQLLPFLALAGGRIEIPARTDHVDASLDLLTTFEYEVRVEEPNRTAVALVADPPDRG